jgi:hypothetical protein
LPAIKVSGIISNKPAKEQDEKANKNQQKQSVVHALADCFALYFFKEGFFSGVGYGFIFERDGFALINSGLILFKRIISFSKFPVGFHPGNHIGYMTSTAKKHGREF